MVQNLGEQGSVKVSETKEMFFKEKYPFHYK
jgi:hypothetical protein